MELTLAAIGSHVEEFTQLFCLCKLMMLHATSSRQICYTEYLYNFFLIFLRVLFLPLPTVIAVDRFSDWEKETAKRGLNVHMTSAKYLDFFIPSPLFCIFTQPPLVRFPTATALEVPSLPPSLCRHHMYMPL